MSAQKSLWEQNVELWEQWTNAYGDTMLKTMGQTLEQSASFRGELERTVNTAATAQLEIMLSALKTVERQMATVVAKVDKILAENE